MMSAHIASRITAFLSVRREEIVGRILRPRSQPGFSAPAAVNGDLAEWQILRPHFRRWDMNGRILAQFFHMLELQLL